MVWLIESLAPNQHVQFFASFLLSLIFVFGFFFVAIIISSGEFYCLRSSLIIFAPLLPERERERERKREEAEKKNIKSGELYLWLVAAFNELRSADAKIEVAGIFTGWFSPSSSSFFPPFCCRISECGYVISFPSFISPHSLWAELFSKRRGNQYASNQRLSGVLSIRPFERRRRISQPPPFNRFFVWLLLWLWLHISCLRPYQIRRAMTERIPLIAGAVLVITCP